MKEREKDTTMDCDIDVVIQRTQTPSCSFFLSINRGRQALLSHIHACMQINVYVDQTTKILLLILEYV